MLKTKLNDVNKFRFFEAFVFNVAGTMPVALPLLHCLIVTMFSARRDSYCHKVSVFRSDKISGTHVMGVILHASSCHVKPQDIIPTLPIYLYFSPIRS